MKSRDPVMRHMGQYVLFMSAESIRVMAILLQPFMPDRMKAALDVMEVLESNRSFHHAAFGADLSYGPPALGVDVEPSTDVIFRLLLSDH